jgi:hypothetical protein
MGNTCCGDGKGRQMTYESTIKVQGWIRHIAAKRILKAKVRTWLMNVANMRSPRSNSKLLEDKVVDQILKESFDPATRRYLIDRKFT